MPLTMPSQELMTLVGQIMIDVGLLARERGGPAIQAQVLHVPALDLTGGSRSLHEQPGLWDSLAPVIQLYASAEQVLDPLVSPLLAKDLSSLHAGCAS